MYNLKLGNLCYSFDLSDLGLRAQRAPGEKIVSNWLGFVEKNVPFFGKVEHLELLCRKK